MNAIQNYIELHKNGRNPLIQINICNKTLWLTNDTRININSSDERLEQV